MAISASGELYAELQSTLLNIQQVSLIITSEGNAQEKLITTENIERYNVALAKLLDYYNEKLVEAIDTIETDPLL